ncbi:MerR family transcriptional regulator [Pseudomonas putida]
MTSGEADLELQGLLPIREVTRLTGVKAVTLRAWERRHGLIQPVRKVGGHRLYSKADIDAIRRILGWLGRGVALGKVADILARSMAPAALTDPQMRLQGQVREAVERFDIATLDLLFDQVFTGNTLDQVFGEIFMPIWHDLAPVQGSFGRASEWLFLDLFLRGRVLSRLQLCRARRSRSVLLAPLSGQCHELELLVTGLLLEGDDIGVTLLAAGQPLQELALICERLRPDALVLYANQPPSRALHKRLARMVEGLQCPLLLAGEVIDLAQGLPVPCLGAHGSVMRQRLRHQLDC